MKKFALGIALLAIILPLDGCKVLKHKTLQKTKTTENIKKDIEVVTAKTDHTNVATNVSKANIKELANESIYIKTAAVQPLELTAKFRLDTGSTLRGDTAFKLVDVNNNGTSITVYQNKRNGELTAKVKTPSTGSRDIPFNELRINRSYSKDTQKVDSLSEFENHSELKIDSLDKTTITKSAESKVQEKVKETKPTFWSWWIIVGVVASAVFVMWLIWKFNLRK